MSYAAWVLAAAPSRCFLVTPLDDHYSSVDLRLTWWRRRSIGS